jgi:hypothetical protein
VQGHEEHPPVAGETSRDLERLTQSHSDFSYLDTVDLHLIISMRATLCGRSAFVIGLETCGTQPVETSFGREAEITIFNDQDDHEA